MNNRDDLFHPENVNEQIEHLRGIQDLQQRDITPGAPTIAALERIYKDDEALLQRAWARLAQVEAVTRTQGNRTNIVDLHHYRGENTMQETTFATETSNPTPPPSAAFSRPSESLHRPRRGWQGMIGLLAAVLVCIMLVGSFALVLTASRNHTANTAVGNSNSTRTTAWASKMILVKQTAQKVVNSKGGHWVTAYVLLLEDLVVTKSTTKFTVSYFIREEGKPRPLILKLQTVNINGQQQSIRGTEGTIEESTTHGSTHISVNGGLDLHQSLPAQSGFWKVQMSLLAESGPGSLSPLLTGTFTFTVPA